MEAAVEAVPAECGGGGRREFEVFAYGLWTLLVVLEVVDRMAVDALVVALVVVLVLVVLTAVETAVE